MDTAFAAWGRRLRASDASACTELFQALHRPLLRYAARLTRDDDAAYDIVQDAFIKLWEHRARLDPEQSVRAYLYTIVRNTAFNQMKQKQHRQYHLDHLEPADPSAEMSDPMAVRELKTQMQTWIEELPPRRQEAFRLSRFNGLTHDEIARVMNLAPRTVTHHIMLALQHLRARLATYQST